MSDQHDRAMADAMSALLGSGVIEIKDHDEDGTPLFGLTDKDYCHCGKDVNTCHHA